MPKGLFMQRLRIKAAPSLAALCLITAAQLIFASVAGAQILSLDNVSGIALSGSSTISAVSIDPSTGNVVVRSSFGDFNSCTRPSVPDPPAINSFTASSGTVTPGSNFSLNWSSSFTSSCTPSQGGSTNWSNLGTLGTNGSQSLTAPQQLGTVTFQLTCTNAAQQTVTRTTQVTVAQNGGTCQPVYSNGSPGEFGVAFGLTWPAYNDKIRQMVSNGQYFSLRFVATNSPTQFGTINTTGFPGDGDGNGQVSISTTPGCFNQSGLGAGCLSGISTYPGVSWTNGQSAFVCKLNPGSAYYVNFYFPDCSNGNCGRDFGNIQQLLQNLEK